MGDDVRVGRLEAICSPIFGVRSGVFSCFAFCCPLPPEIRLGWTKEAGPSHNQQTFRRGGPSDLEEHLVLLEEPEEEPFDGDEADGED